MSIGGLSPKNRSLRATSAAGYAGAILGFTYSFGGRDMAWVVLISSDRGYAHAYGSEAEARQAAETAAQAASADAWVVVANQATSAAWVIKNGSVKE